MAAFQDLGLIDELLSAIETAGYENPTPVQEQAIPAILRGIDILASAQTGTGKTAAFLLPILQKLNLSKTDSETRVPRALILTPTRELAIQVAQNFEVYSANLDLKATAVFGGASMGTQIKKLEKGVDIIIATPGRLLDHTSQQTVDLSQLEFLVLDEADRMLDMGFKHDIRKIKMNLPKKKHSMLFSATFPPEVMDLAASTLVNPSRVQVARTNAAADTVSQVVHPVAANRKFDLLTHIINEGDLNQVLVFTKTKDMANRVVDHLKGKKISAVALHGNKTQAARKRALQDFKDIKVRILVATDIAARGLDIDTLRYVINFELPGVTEDYIHRIGRTGRAGSKGKAITFVSAQERRHLKDIERFLKKEIPEEKVGDFARGDSIISQKKNVSVMGGKKSSSNERQYSDGDKRGAKKRLGPKPKKKNQKKFKRR
ncbi:MAG: DEAD/DEAH box helicase [Lentisphaeraceae bacterium]|nr:DEAD/DEAH box helicase [Lentisphaeraceae bacterium]